ncbi:hypothetical protein [Olsenella sp. HMSC062G07]|uniref:hypothetical protein n=1 Tax=Olsenella sp. HMSC062G07 TaxID=1739330 RepID=UPI0008A5ABA2|nr:hypothetical protein [Olsenella sp. HMSC062G07]OFK24152.1 hypothetical protein HMPREF2826_08500 [Olsenella sp. HMSC062G07]
MAKNDPLETALGRRSALAGHAVKRGAVKERYPRTINIPIDEDTFQAIALYAAKHGMQKNDTARKFLVKGLEKELDEIRSLWR